MKLLWFYTWWTWQDTLAAAGGATVILVLAEKLKKAGINTYRGAGLIWKWIMRTATYRKEMENRHAVLYKMVNDISQQIGEIRKQLYPNGGASILDNQLRIEKLVSQQAEVMVMMDTRMNIADVANRRMTFRMNNEGACTEINEVFLKRFGYNEKDILGFGFESVVHEEDIMEMRSKWQRAIEQAGRFYDEQRIFDAQRKEWLCCVRAEPVCKDEKIVGFVGYIEFINT